jgi:hypothetical protein
MRNLLALFAAGLITFAVVGWYLDWYTVKSTPGAAGHHNVHIDINGAKIGQDLHKGQEKLLEKVRQNELGKAAEGNQDEPPQPAFPED